MYIFLLLNPIIWLVIVFDVLRFKKWWYPVATTNLTHWNPEKLCHSLSMMMRWRRSVSGYWNSSSQISISSWSILLFHLVNVQYDEAMMVVEVRNEVWKRAPRLSEEWCPSQGHTGSGSSQASTDWDNLMYRKLKIDAASEKDDWITDHTEDRRSQ